MDDPSGVRGARTSLAIAFTIFTALVALLWVLPKSPGGGFWLFTLPAALLFPYFTYRVIAPRSAERTSKDSVVMIAALVVLYLGGVVVRSLALPEANLTGAAATMESLTETWRTYSLWTLLVVGVLTLVERSKTGSSAPKATSASEPVVAASGEAVPAKLPTSGRGPVEVTRPSPLVPAQPAPQPAAIRPTTTSRPATVPAPAWHAQHGHAPRRWACQRALRCSRPPLLPVPSRGPPPCPGRRSPTSRHSPRSPPASAIPAPRPRFSSAPRRRDWSSPQPARRSTPWPEPGTVQSRSAYPRDFRGALDLLSIAGVTQRPVPPRR